MLHRCFTVRSDGLKSDDDLSRPSLWRALAGADWLSSSSSSTRLRLVLLELNEGG